MRTHEEIAKQVTNINKVQEDVYTGRIKLPGFEAIVNWGDLKTIGYEHLGILPIDHTPSDEEINHIIGVFFENEKMEDKPQDRSYISLWIKR